MQRHAILVNPSVVTAAASVVSVALAVFAAHALQLEDSWWAAISAVMVMQENFFASLYRGVLRIAGTILGGMAALAIGPLLAGSPLLFVAAISLATFVTLFAALKFRHSHAWVLALITFVMVMAEAARPHAPLDAFAVERVANVVVGTVACVVVAGFLELRSLLPALRREHWLRERLAAATGRLTDAPVDNRAAALHALQGAIAMLPLAVVVGHWNMSALAQGMVTTVAVLIVPLDVHSAAPRMQVTRRMLERFLGCLLAGVLAFALFPLIEAQPLLCQIALGLGIAAGTGLQSVLPKYRYVAIQFTIAFIMVFVQDHGWTVDEEPAAARLAGVVAGVVLLYIVLVFFPRTARQP